MMPDAPLARASSAWAFAVDFYARPGVADACIVLQDELNVDVVLLLFALYAERHGRPLDAQHIAEAEALLSPWRQQVISPLRALRRQMKQAEFLVPAIAVERIRGRVKEAELRAEKVSLELLAHRFPVGKRAALSSPDALSEVPVRIASFYGEDRRATPHQGQWSPLVKEAMRTLLHAAQQTDAEPVDSFRAKLSSP